MYEEYPKVLYREDGSTVRVLSADEEAEHPECAQSPAGPFGAPAKAQPKRKARANMDEDEDA